MIELKKNQWSFGQLFHFFNRKFENHGSVSELSIPICENHGYESQESPWYPVQGFGVVSNTRPTLVQRGRVLLLEGMAKSPYEAQGPKP